MPETLCNNADLLPRELDPDDSLRLSLSLSLAGSQRTGMEQPRSSLLELGRILMLTSLCRPGRPRTRCQRTDTRRRPRNPTPDWRCQGTGFEAPIVAVQG